MARTDDDTWDLTSGVGATATGVAAARAWASKQPDALIDDPFAEPLIAALGISYYADMANGNVGEAGVGLGIDRDLLADGMAIRTQFVDEFFTDAADAGIRQAVILASGLDTRPYRLDWPSGMTVFEVDQPKVIEFKVAALASLGARPTAALRSVGIDLRLDWPAALAVDGFDETQPTAWIAEGLLGYLPPDAQDQFFDAITDLSASGSRFATDWHPDLGGTVNDRAHEAAQAEQSRAGVALTDLEDMIYLGERNDVAEYLCGLGWQVHTHTAEQRFADNHRPFRRDAAVIGLVGAHYSAATLR